MSYIFSSQVLSLSLQAYQTCLPIFYLQDFPTVCKKKKKNVVVHSHQSMLIRLQTKEQEPEMIISDELTVKVLNMISILFCHWFILDIHWFPLKQITSTVTIQVQVKTCQFRDIWICCQNTVRGVTVCGSAGVAREPSPGNCQSHYEAGKFT